MFLDLEKPILRLGVAGLGNTQPESLWFPESQFPGKQVLLGRASFLAFFSRFRLESWLTGFLMVELGQRWTRAGWYYSIAAPDLTARTKRDPTEPINLSHTRKIPLRRILWSSQ